MLIENRPERSDCIRVRRKTGTQGIVCRIEALEAPALRLRMNSRTRMPLNACELEIDLLCRGLRVPLDVSLNGSRGVSRTRAGLGSGLEIALPAPLATSVFGARREGLRLETRKSSAGLPTYRLRVPQFRQ